MLTRILFSIVLIMSFSTVFSTDTEQYYHDLRKKMVEEQIFRRGITDRRILDAFMNVKRHLFVLPKFRELCYRDFPVDIGEGQSITQPYSVAVMTYAVAPDYNKKVLEIGTGSGYHTAIIAELVKTVYTIELNPILAHSARKRLEGLGYRNIKYRIGDGYEGWTQYAPYDSIVVTCGEDHIPQALIDQLAVGGRMIIPVSYASNVQELILLEKQDNKGDLKKTSLIPVQVVPMIRGSEKK